MKVSPIRLIHNENNDLVTVDFGHGGRAVDLSKTSKKYNIDNLVI